jgi:hypothetical protein
MARIDFLGYDGKTSTDGTPKLLREYANLDLKSALKFTKNVVSGRKLSVDVPFIRRESFLNEMRKRGFVVV